VSLTCRYRSKNTKKWKKVSFSKSKVPFKNLFWQKWELFRVVLCLVVIVLHFGVADVPLSVEKYKKNAKKVSCSKSKVPFKNLLWHKWELFRVLLCLVVIVLHFGVADMPLPVEKYKKKQKKVSFSKSKVPFENLFWQKWELFQVVLCLVIIVLHFGVADVPLSVEKYEKMQRKCLSSRVKCPLKICSGKNESCSGLLH